VKYLYIYFYIVAYRNNAIKYFLFYTTYYKQEKIRQSKDNYSFSNHHLESVCMTPNYLPFHKMKSKIKQELKGLKTFSFNLIYTKITNYI